jgi:hypothetical protein
MRVGPVKKQKNLNGRQPGTANELENHSCVCPEWKTHLAAYEEKTLLTFASEKELEAAIDFLWTDQLRTLPHDTPDGQSIVVPSEAVEFFTRAGLAFASRSLPSIRDLSPSAIRKLRHSN